MDKLVQNYLFRNEKVKIWQDTQMFNFSLDTVLIANFVKPRKNDRVCDFGTNNGAIPMMITAKGFSGEIIGIEIQERAVEIAKKNIGENGFTNIKIEHNCIKEYVAKNSGKKFDLIYCNPPFFKYSETSNLNDSEYKIVARHEKHITLEEIILSAAKVLENKGTFVIVHRAQRVSEILHLMVKYEIMPKTIQFVYSKENVDATTVLVEGKFKSLTETKVLPALIAHNEDGSYSQQVEKMFELEEK